MAHLLKTNFCIFFFRLSELNAQDQAKVRRESALNSLESFVFDAQNKLETDEYKKAATKDELESILTKCKQVNLSFVFCPHEFF